ncbi:MAG: GNAT family N-acetyltransferase, partial [Chloroflexi bacterium]|nr:GNAT family N-acetyltransferase [Chloroflexota bacterium]
RQVRAFVHLPYIVYRDNPYWVPPLLAEEKKLLDPRLGHPFYRHSAAAFFLAEDEGEVRGRIGVMENRRYNEHLGQRSAFFGYLEAVNDLAVSRTLFDAAFQWARDRGLERMEGPRTLLDTNAAGLLVEGFDLLPAMGIPYNPPYYETLVRDAGLAKHRDNLSGYISGEGILPERIARLAERLRRRSGLTVISPGKGSDLRAWVQRVARVYIQAFATHDDFVPPTEEEIELFAGQILSIADPRLVKIALKEDQPVGFVLSYPNINEGLQRARGRLWPLGWYYILRARRATKRLDINGLGVLPEYRGLGANVLMYSELAKTIKALGYTHLELVQVQEDNFRSLHDQEALGATWYKRHRMFRCSL